jgi:hypothetical protein
LWSQIGKCCLAMIKPVPIVMAYLELNGHQIARAS